jgi:hypothetical protein
MAATKIRGNTQIQDGTIENTQISATAAIATTKLADGAEFIQRDGSVAFTADQSLGGFKLTNLAAPTNPNDAARKADVDAAASGLDVKESVRVASTANVAIATDLEAGDTIDGVTLVAGDRVLLKDQTTASQNGIYVAVASGAASRSTDADTDAEVTAGMFMFVEEGTANADKGFVLVSDNPLIVDTDDLIFTQFSGAGSGDVNSASNVNNGAGAVGVFKQLNGDDLEFYSLDEAASGKVTVTLNSNEIEFDIGAGTLVDGDINASAAIARTKIASGSANHVVINDGSGVLSSEAQLSLARGGTASDLSAAAGDRILVSNSGGTALVEHSAITANRALASDGNGLPVASAVTDTELGYLSGVTSSVQTQLDAKADSADFVSKEVPTGLINGSNTSYSLVNTPISGTEHVYLNGVLQEEGAGNDYTISGSTITYLTAPETGDKLVVSYRK